MRIFTKSLLAFALLLVADGVSAQKVWQKVFTQGWVHEWRTDEAQTDAAIEPDAEGVYTVFCRSSEQAEAAGNATHDGDGNFASWDSQFFITWGEENALKEGDKFKVSFKYKADSEANGIGTQAHGAPGSYNHWDMIGSFNFTDEWQEFASDEVTISADQGKNNGCWTIAFNLAIGDEHTFYFKDIIVEIYGDKKATKTVVSEKMDWTQLVINGDMEGEDVSSFWVRYWPYENGTGAYNAEIFDGVGVDNSRGIKIAATDRSEEHLGDNYGGYSWDNQFWFLFTDYVPAGTKYKASFDYRSDEEAPVNTQTHDTPSDYVYYDWWGDINFGTDWAHFTREGTVSASQYENGSLHFRSVAFNLSPDSHPNANNYYFDNVSFEVGKLVNHVQHFEEGIQVLFTAWTNMPDLIIESANGKRRLVMEENFPVKVTIDGEEVKIQTVEYDREGQLYIFPDEEYVADHPMTKDQKIVVTFTNPEDAKYRLLYTAGDNVDKAVEDFTAESEYSEEIFFLPFAYGPPELESTDPEEGSFNLPNTISEFKVKFDKNVQFKYIEAKLGDKEKLTVSYQGDEGDEIILKRAAGAAALPDGKHTITISKVYGVTDAQLVEPKSFTLNFSVGAQISEDLTYALDKAKAALEESEDARYDGNAKTALQEAVAEYDANLSTFTAPSAVKEAVYDLSLKTEALQTHKKNCDTYDQSLASAIELVAQYADSKFAKADLFKVLQEAVGKYEGKQLTDDDELQAAVDDLETNVKAGQNMFTEGESRNGDAGIKVLVERIRRGAEALVALGISEEDELIVAANNVLTDDDDLAEQIKNKMKLEVYGKLKDGDESIFSSEVDDEGNETQTGPDFSIFVKNPNMYAIYPKNGINLENTPGWDRLNGDMGLWGSGGANWGNPRNIEGLPEDCAFTIYRADTRAEQIITDLPAGNYLVTVYGTDWGHTAKVNDETGEPGPDPQGFVYVKTSETPTPEEGEEEDRDVHFYTTCGAFFAEPEYSMDGAHNMEVPVTDGKLTIGLQFKSDSQYFFGDVKVTLIGKAEGVDYAALYNDVAQEIQNIKQNVNYNVYFDLQGRRIAKPTKGLYIKNNKKVVIK